MIRKLTGAFTKNLDSNVGKLILLISEQNEKIIDTFTKIENWRDINQAEGTTLDLIGKGRRQERGKATDEIMRVLIKSKIARDSSDGTINGIIQSLALSLNTSLSTIKIRALYSEGQPAALMIDDLPIESLNRVGMSTSQLGAIAQEITVSGVRIASIDLSGSFAFSSQSNVLETSIDFGLAPLDQSTGGTLGGTFDPNEEVILPL